MVTTIKRSRPRIFAFEGRGDLNLDFGEWDKYGEKNFIALFFQAMEQRLLEKTDFYTSVEK
ncbi:MAG TPA: hypothetical protein VEL31_11265 [Ktedonobacteraceae bacterium]|nr:hypothetical protein [Ktedonobacteraceae bacterium]